MQSMQVGKKKILMLACSINQLWLCLKGSRWARECEENFLYKQKLDHLPKASPKNKNVVIINSFQPCIIFFLLWNTKGCRNIWADLFCTTEVDGNLYCQAPERTKSTIKIVHATMYSKSCTIFPHSKLLNCFRRLGICWAEGTFMVLLSILVVWKSGE